MSAGVALCLGSVVALLLSHARQWTPGRWIFKPLASAGFILAAVGWPEPSTPTTTAGMVLLAGLTFGALGDVALIGRSTRALAAGIVCFALMHVAYVAFFLTNATRWWTFLPAAIGVFAVAHLVWKWLERHLGPRWQLPVRAYIALVALMGSSALASIPPAVVASQQDAAGPALALAAIGGGLLAVSDVAVARDRFIEPEFGNKLWGLPLYYVGQLLIAAAVV